MLTPLSPKAASRLHFLKQLKRTGAPIGDLLHFYTAVVRPVLEYACPVWHCGLTVAQSNELEFVQKRAICMTFPDADYELSLFGAGIVSLQDRREALTARFFKRQVLASSSVLHYLLPYRRDSDSVASLRNPKPYQLIRTRTVKYQKSFLPYCLNKYT